MEPHPILLLLLEVTVCAAVLGFTNPQSPLRLGGLLVVFLCMWQCITTSPIYLVRSAWASLAGGYAVMLFFHYIDIVLLSQWSFEPNVSATERPQYEHEAIRHHKSSGTKKRSSWKEKLKFGLSSTFTARFCGTTHEVRHVPRFSNSDPDHVPSRTQFIRNTALTVLLCYLILDAMDAGADPAMVREYFSEQNIPLFRRFRDVSGNELLMRASGSIGVILGLMCSQGGFYNLFALIGNVLGLSAPKDWPPFYGSPLEAYSLRRFWSLFWHQTNTHKFNSISNFILRNVFNIQSRRGLIPKYARVVTIFSLSAVMHFLIDISAGVPVHKSGAIPFFCTQAFGIVIEDRAIKLYSFITAYTNVRLPVLVERVLGFTWVGLFLVWSIPMYVYPMMYRTAAGLDDAIVPFRIIGLFK
ncbi:hypothetical protein ANOM_011116 [Aspergillus nomiae NRRL 13137]|uniref:Wax synthase domain-containing protein n=1 Tax=Aspergillus nomiae NRRL (strain ATCC 15546 / NRRL 13137 / CBS 260.88 / M93) TaxID=1509407 RepID=A0A0L1ILR5_ASPN3|nr:uncharacterized protein ANOM_011116 [Aspergillus nomiae NRRL 13137]KNG80432.1 hypothetical protein ANOM_011116 [Aspergillus nomiae NRRL 13137]